MLKRILTIFNTSLIDDNSFQLEESKARDAVEDFTKAFRVFDGDGK